VSLVVDSVDATLRELFLRRATLLRRGTPAGAATTTQVGFQPPDKDWRTVVKGLGDKRALNVYLVDLRENRKLRSNDRRERVDQGLVFEEPAPMRVDCHYLITAWSPATEQAGRTLEEHELLSEVLGLVANVHQLVPREVFTPGGLPGNFPGQLADAELPLTLLPTEGFVKLAEFWGTMPGPTHPWKPAVYLVVTVPVLLEQTLAGPQVTTRTTEYRQNGWLDSAEILVQIAGVVRDSTAAPPAPIAHAWVRLEDSTGRPLQTTETNERGEYTFLDLSPGSYRLRTRAAGRAQPPVSPITVPAPTGRYDLEFT
jgi:Pvc16 N-terminal domain/Carboxypeptidase regulatory-like domain